MRKDIIFIVSALLILQIPPTISFRFRGHASRTQLDSEDSTEGNIPKDFVYVLDHIPNIIPNLRYATHQNFVGRPIDGYSNDTKVVLTKQATEALKKVNKQLNEDGYQLVIYDSYRPQRAVDNFYRWSQDKDDDKMKQYYYPYVDKAKVFDKGYVAKKSGHSRGSTLDVGIIKNGTKLLKPVEVKDRKFKDGREFEYLYDGTPDFGTSFDFFDPTAHYDTKDIYHKAQEMREYLCKVFEDNGFVRYENEWWHFTLKDEPFPDTYFNFLA